MDLPLSPSHFVHTQAFKSARRQSSVCVCVCFQGDRGTTQFSSAFQFPSITPYFLSFMFFFSHISHFLSVYASCFFLPFMSRAAQYLRGGRLVGSSTVQYQSFLYILKQFCHVLLSEDSLVNTSHLISEIITSFDGELCKVVKIILSFKNMNYKIRMLASFSLGK